VLSSRISRYFFRLEAGNRTNFNAKRGGSICELDYSRQSRANPRSFVPDFGLLCLESGMSVTVIARAAAEPTFRNLRFIDIGGKVSIFPIFESPPTI